MKNECMVRYGTETQKMRPMGRDDILVSRLNLLIIMAKAFLKSYPMGEFRRKAISENARFVFHEASMRSRSKNVATLKKARPQDTQGSTDETDGNDDLFLLRAQLLAVMVNAFALKKSKGRFRKRALAENIDHISAYLANGFKLGGLTTLKVA